MQNNFTAVEEAKVPVLVSTTELLTGNQVLDLLSDLDFCAGWDTLYQTCSLSTVFQSRKFVANWYKHYSSNYLPVIIKQTKGRTLTGLLTMAKDSKGNLIGAGANQAEYQVWLTAETDNNSFIKDALHKLRNNFPKAEIILKYVPGNAPLQGIVSDNYWNRYCFRRTFKQPLLILDKERLTQELKKKNRREKINRLKRLGDLKFEQVTDRQNFINILDELAIQSDFRKGAMFNKTVFIEDTFRKPFLLSLFDSGLLHTTLLKLNGKVIASNVGAAGKGWVHLQGINTHSPIYARYSPGILHFLMLGNTLAEEGYSIFDLTPGTDAYKDSLATAYTNASELTIGSKSNVARKRFYYKISERLKDVLPKLGIHQSAVRELKQSGAVLKGKIKAMRTASIPSLIKNGLFNLSPGATSSLYFFNKRERTSSIKILISQDNLGDLLKYNQSGSLITKWEFLMEAMKRFEAGQHAYTWCREGQLLACAWLSDTENTRLQVYAATELPDNAAVLHSFYIKPAVSYIKRFIEAILFEVTREHDSCYVITSSRDSRLRKLLEAIEA